MDEEPSFVTSCKVLLTPAEPLTTPVLDGSSVADTGTKSENKKEKISVV